MDGEGAAAAGDVFVFRAVDGEGFLPEGIVLACVAGDVADVLEFRGDGVVDY